MEGCVENNCACPALRDSRGNLALPVWETSWTPGLGLLALLSKEDG